jgi:hypothetical protein
VHQRRGSGLFDELFSPFLTPLHLGTAHALTGLILIETKAVDKRKLYGESNNLEYVYKLQLLRTWMNLMYRQECETSIYCAVHGYRFSGANLRSG